MEQNSRGKLTPLAKKLGNYLQLGDAELAVLNEMTSGREKFFPPRTDIVREGEHSRVMRIMISGWAHRYKQLPDGRRQTVGYFLPGDICDLHIPMLNGVDYSLASLSPATIIEIEYADFEKLLAVNRRLEKAFWWEGLANLAIQREWAVNLGLRTAFERLAHLFCELYTRLESVGLASGDEFEFPLTQTDLAEATGISTVHVNRTLKELREAELTKFIGRKLVMPNMSRLRSVAAFDARYLHLGQAGERLDDA
jgi:CRP-like cAMP-binding protein